MGQALSQTPTAKARRRLADGDAVEYLVVGAGPAGLQAAYFLKKFGLDHAVAVSYTHLTLPTIYSV